MLYFTFLPLLAAAPANINSEQSNFQEMMHTRKMQAHRSLLVGVPENENIPFAVAYFEKYGSITNAYCLAGEGSNVSLSQCYVMLWLLSIYIMSRT